jgi:hypothetical protein
LLLRLLVFFTSHWDLSAIHAAVSELVSVAPIDSQDKDRINSRWKRLRIAQIIFNDFLEGNKLTGGEVYVKESDIVEGACEFLQTPAGKLQLRMPLRVQSTEGNGNGVEQSPLVLIAGSLAAMALVRLRKGRLCNLQ